MQCPGCGAENQGKFCRGCGKALNAAAGTDAPATAAAQKSCGSCGHACKAEAKFCPHCGGRFDAQAAPIAGEVPAPAAPSRNLLPLIAIVALIAIAGAAYGIYAWWSVPKTTTAQDNVPDTPTTVQPQVAAPDKKQGAPVADAAPPPKAPAAQTPHKAPATQTPAPPVNTAKDPQWLLSLRKDLEQCNRKSSFSAALCAESARLQHCFPDRWGSVPECPKTEQPTEQ